MISHHDFLSMHDAAADSWQIATNMLERMDGAALGLFIQGGGYPKPSTGLKTFGFHQASRRSSQSVCAFVVGTAKYDI